MPRPPALPAFPWKSALLVLLLFPSSRAHAEGSATRFIQSPIVDGQLTDPCWAALGVTPDSPLGSTWVGFDDQYLYIAGITTAGSLSTSLPPESDHIWHAERIELKVSSPQWSARRLRAVAHPSATTKTLWESTQAGRPPTGEAIEGLRMPGTYSKGRCLIEAAIPWNVLPSVPLTLTLTIVMGHVPTSGASPASGITAVVTRPASLSTSPSPDREHELERAGSLDRPETLPTLVETFDIPDPDLSQAADRALRKRPAKDVIQAIRQWAVDRPRTIKGRLRAVQFLQTLRDPDRYTALLDLLASEPDSTIQIQAAKSFSGTEGLTVLLQAAQHDAAPAKRRVALGLIGSARLTDPQVFPALERALSADREWPVRVQAVWTANQLEDPRVLPALHQALQSDTEPAVRAAIAKSLGSFGDLRATVPLSIALRQDASPLVRDEAAKALGRLNDPSSIPVLETALKDEDPTVRESALQALNKLKPTRKTGNENKTKQK